MRVLSLCDGLSCGLLAFKELGIDVEYHAVEIDKFARALSDSNFPDIIRPCNDVYELTSEKLDGIGAVDWVIFGFPCQKFSVAGKQGGLQADPILIQCMKILNRCKEKNPNLKYLIENVKMKKSLLEEVDAVIQSPERTLINSALVSAQNRERYYWTNFPVAQPEDRGLVIADILEEEPNDITELSSSTVDRFKRYGVPFLDGSESKSRCLSAREYEKNGRQGNYLKVFKYSESNRYTKADGTTTQKASEAATREVERRMIPSDKSLTLTTGEDSLHYRKLTVRECARLQTIPEWYSFDAVSKTQAYKAIGNGMTVSVIAHIIKESCN